MLKHPNTKRDWTRRRSGALHRAVLTCSCVPAALRVPNSQSKRQQSDGRNCTAASSPRILICENDARNRAKCSASEIAEKGRSYTAICQPDALRNGNCRYTEPGGAPLGLFYLPPCWAGPNFTADLLQCPQQLISALNDAIDTYIFIYFYFLLHNFHLFYYNLGQLTSCPPDANVENKPSLPL